MGYYLVRPQPRDNPYIHRYHYQGLYREIAFILPYQDPGSECRYWSRVLYPGLESVVHSQELYLGPVGYTLV